MTFGGPTGLFPGLRNTINDTCWAIYQSRVVVGDSARAPGHRAEPNPAQPDRAVLTPAPGRVRVLQHRTASRGRGRGRRGSIVALRQCTLIGCLRLSLCAKAVPSLLAARTGEPCRAESEQGWAVRRKGRERLVSLRRPRFFHPLLNPSGQRVVLVSVCV